MRNYFGIALSGLREYLNSHDSLLGLRSVTHVLIASVSWLKVRVYLLMGYTWGGYYSCMKFQGMEEELYSRINVLYKICYKKVNIIANIFF